MDLLQAEDLRRVLIVELRRVLLEPYKIQNEKF